MESRGDLFYLLGKTLTDKEVIQHYLFILQNIGSLATGAFSEQSTCSLVSRVFVPVSGCMSLQQLHEWISVCAGVTA